MFGKTEWFENRGVLRLWPICWQGWLCALIWAAVLVLPFLFLLSIQKTPEAFIWLLVLIGFIVGQARQFLAKEGSVANDVAKEDGASKDDVLYIGDDADATHVATRNYDLHLRD